MANDPYRKGNYPGGGGRGSCGGVRRQDGSGQGKGNRGSNRQPNKRGK